MERINMFGGKETGYLTKDSILVGEHKYYYPNGKLLRKEFMVEGKASGLGKMYYPNGALHRVVNCEYGKEEDWLM